MTPADPAQRAYVTHPQPGERAVVISFGGRDYLLSDSTFAEVEAARESYLTNRWHRQLGADDKAAIRSALQQSLDAGGGSWTDTLTGAVDAVNGAVNGALFGVLADPNVRTAIVAGVQDAAADAGDAADKLRQLLETAAAVAAIVGTIVLLNQLRRK